MDNLQARYSFYTKLYKKYSPDLSDEEIGQEVRNLSHAENQQESIDNFYKNVVGKPVTAKQRVKISQFVDPQATQGIIDSENAKNKAAYEEAKAKYDAEQQAIQDEDEAKKAETAADINKRFFENYSKDNFRKVYGIDKSDNTKWARYYDERDLKLDTNRTYYSGGGQRLGSQIKELVDVDAEGNVTMNTQAQLDYLKKLNIKDYEDKADGPISDAFEEGLGFWGELISTGSTDKAWQKYYDLEDNNLKEREILEKIKENPNYVDDTNLEVLKAKKEIKLRQKETVKDSETYNLYEEQLKKLDKQFVSLTNVSKEIQVQDFFDFYDEVVGTGSQIGKDGTGTSLFGSSTIDNFPTYEEYISRYGGTADTYTMLEDLNNINKDAEIAKKLYKEYDFTVGSSDASTRDEKRNKLLAENQEEIQRLANDNDIDYDTLKNYITLGPIGPNDENYPFQNVGSEAIGNLFNDRRNLVSDRYDKFMKGQGFARDNWLDDEYIKTVYGDENPELLNLIQGKDVSVGISEIGIQHYKSFLPDDIEERVAFVRDGSDEVIYKTLPNGQIIATNENDQTEFKKKQELLQEVDESMQSAIMQDPEIKFELEDLKKAALPELEKYKKELIDSGDYNLEDIDDVAKIDELLMKKQHELVTLKLLETPTFKRRSNEIGMAFGAISGELGIDFTRQQSGFTRFMDSIYDRKDFDSYNPLNWVGELVLGIGSGVEGITSAIGDSAVASVEGFIVRQYDNELNKLEEGLENGDFTEDDLIDWQFNKWVKVGKGNRLGQMLGANEDSYLNRNAGSKAGDKLKEIKGNKNYWNESIAKQMMEYARSTRRQESGFQADFSDGINLQEAISTIGQALPHIGLAAGGTILGGVGGVGSTFSTIAGYLGTVTMGLQMYGDNYMTAITNNLEKKGLDKEGIRRRLKEEGVEFTEQDVEEQYMANLRDNFATGEGANIATSAAFAAAQAFLESYGAEQMVGATQKALSKSSLAPGLAAKNLWSATWDDFSQYALDTIINSGASGIKEFGTEYAQEVLGQIAQGAQDTEEGSLFSYIDGSESLQAGIGGLITGASLPLMGATTKQSKNAFRQFTAKLNLFGGKNAEKISNAWYRKSKEQLDSDLKNKKISKKDYYNQMKMISASYNAGVKMRQGNFTNTMLKENRVDLHDLYVDIETMQQEVNDATNNKPLQDALKGELGLLQSKATDIIQTERGVKNLQKIAKDKGFSNEVNVLNSRAEVKKYMKDRGLKYEPQSVGQYDPETGTIVMDRKMAADMSEGGTAGHELMHKVLFNTLYKVSKDGTIEGKGVVQGLGNMLDEYLAGIDTENSIGDSVYLAKLNMLYGKDSTNASTRAEEKFTLFRDALANGDIKFDENVFTKVGDVLRRVLQAVGMKDIKFNDGRDVYNFIKDFNYDFDRGKQSKALDKMRTKGAAIGENVEFIADEGNFGTRKNNKAFSDLANSYKSNPADTDIENLLNQYRNVALKALNYDIAKGDVAASEAVSFVDSQFQSIINRYDGSTDFSTWVNANIKPKQQQFYESQIGKAAKTTSIDDARAQQVVDETTQQEFDDVAKEDKGREKVYASQTDQVGDLDTAETKAVIKDEVSKDILLAANKGKNAADTARDIANESKKNYFKRLRKDIGTFSSQKYKDFVNSLDKNFIKSLPVAIIKRRFGKLFGIKQTGTTKTKQTSKTGKPSYFNKQVFSVPKVTNEGLQEFKDYFLGGEKRQQSLYNILATDFALESIQELMADKNFMSKLQTALGDGGITAQEFMQNIENKLDVRNVEGKSLDVVKANKALTKKQKAKIQFDKQLEYVQFNKDKLAEIFKAQKVPMKDGVRDLDAIFPETLIKDQKPRTYREVQNTVINDFLADQPTAQAVILRQLLRQSIRGSKRLMYNTVEEFDQAIPPIKGSLKTAKGAEGDLARAIRYQYKVASSKASAKAGTTANMKPSAVTFFESKEFRNNENLKMPELFSTFEAMGKFLNKGDNMKYFSVFDTMMDDTGNNQNHFVRYMAPINFYPIDPKTNKPITNQKIAEEHSLPATNVGRLLLYAAVTGQMEVVKPFIESAYMQGALLATDDTKLNNAKLRSTMDSAFNDIYKGLLNGDIKALGNGLASLSRYTSGEFINPNGYYLIKEGKSIADYYGVKLPFDQQSPNAQKAQLNAINAQLQGMSRAEALANFKEEMKVVKSTDSEKKNNVALNPDVFSNNQTSQDIKDTMINSLKTRVNAVKFNKARKGISVFDFDDTLATTNSKVQVTDLEGNTFKIDATEFAKESMALEEAGATFDFTEFNKVVDGKKGPLADLALKRQGKFGSGDIFVLTARPQVAAQGIKTFLDGIGLNIPLGNITGLENGSPQAKADWVLEKTSLGYNDFYFADDAVKNVKAVKQILDQVDVKSDVQIAKFNKAFKLNQEFNKILEETTGKEAFKTYSKTRGRLEGQKKDKGLLNWLGNQLTITPSAEDFMGLMYDLIGKGELGNQHKAWIKENLVDLMNKAEQELLSAKVSVANDFAALRKKFPSLKTSKLGTNPLLAEIGVGPYTKSQAMRVYMWNKQGMDIPGLSTRDQNALVAAVEADSELKTFADNVILIQKDSTYPAPGASWVAGNISSDIMQSMDKGFRNKLLTDFNQNLEVIFSPENMAKLEALYGTKWVEALKDSIRRMKAGSNRPVYQGGGARVVNNLLDWLNGSVGAIMFLNMRSGLLQLTSAINFVNWGDNNIYAAAKAFANQKQWWSDVLMLMNSDYLVNRRDGLKINVNEAELVDAGKKGGMKGALAYLLDKGFLVTRIMDSLAIGTGGAAFYRNRVNALLKRQNPDTGKKYTKAEAETQAFSDFYAIAEESQQSSNPSKISQQQASLAGRVILSFQNTTMQYMRMQKKAVRDLYNRRKNAGQTQRESDLSNLSKIIYYSTIQNIIFHSLQQALFAGLFDDEEEEDKDKNKTGSIANGMLDSILFGLGFGGAGISTVKNVVLELAKQGQKKAPKYEEATWSVFDFSPVLDSKVRKLKSAFKSFSWNMDEMKNRGWSIDNPAYLAVAQIVAAGTNAPLDRVLRKVMNIRAAMDEETRTWQKVALMMGWDTWSVNLPYWGLQSTIRKEEEDAVKIKADFKADVRKLKADGYKKTMTPEKYDDVVEMKSPYGTVMYYYKLKK